MIPGYKKVKLLGGPFDGTLVEIPDGDYTYVAVDDAPGRISTIVYKHDEFFVGNIQCFNWQFTNSIEGPTE